MLRVHILMLGVSLMLITTLVTESYAKPDGVPSGGGQQGNGPQNGQSNAKELYRMESLSQQILEKKEY